MLFFFGKNERTNEINKDKKGRKEHGMIETNIVSIILCKLDMYNHKRTCTGCSGGGDDKPLNS